MDTDLVEFRQLQEVGIFSYLVYSLAMNHVYCKTREISNLWKMGKIIISVKIRKLLSRPRMMKRISLLESSREI